MKTSAATSCWISGNDIKTGSSARPSWLFSARAVGGSTSISGLNRPRLRGTRFAAAEQLLSSGKNAEAAAAFAAVAADAPAGYATLAQLARANALAAQDPKAGATAYDEVAANGAVDPAYQEIARLRGAYLRVDSDDPKAFEQRYASYAGPDSPYRNAYRELLALADTRRGDFASAAHWFELAAADPSSPPALRARADAFLTIVQAGPVPTK